LPRLPPEGQAWLNGLNHYCRRAVEHDSRSRRIAANIAKLPELVRRP
jgi:hypothetical protein